MHALFSKYISFPQRNKKKQISSCSYLLSILAIIPPFFLTALLTSPCCFSFLQQTIVSLLSATKNFAWFLFGLAIYFFVFMTANVKDMHQPVLFFNSLYSSLKSITYTLILFSIPYYNSSLNSHLPPSSNVFSLSFCLPPLSFVLHFLKKT